MKKLIKLSTDNFVIVDESLEIKDDDMVFCMSNYYNNFNHSAEYQINPIRNFRISDTSEQCLKITHSTSDVANTININLSEIKGLIGEFDVEGNAIAYASSHGNINPEAYSDEQIGRLHGYIDGCNQQIQDKNFYSEEEIEAVLNGWANEVYFGHVRINFIERLQRNKILNSEWNVDIVDDKIIIV